MVLFKLLEISGPVLDKSKDKNSVLAARFVRSCPRERPRSKNQRLDKVQDSWREKVQHCTTKNLRNNILELCIESRFLQKRILLSVNFVISDFSRSHLVMYTNVYQRIFAS